jgi:hypothetical protein
VHKKMGMTMHEATGQISYPFIHSRDIWKNIVHGAWCLHPHTIYPNTNKGARGPPVSQHGSANQ